MRASKKTVPEGEGGGKGRVGLALPKRKERLTGEHAKGYFPKGSLVWHSLPINSDEHACISLCVEVHRGQCENEKRGEPPPRQVIKTNNQLILMLIESTGTVAEPELSVTLRSDKEISEEDVKSAENIIISMFNLNFDLKEFYEFMKSDPVMSKLTKELRGLNRRTASNVFEALASSIIEQQISLIASQSIERRMIKDHGEKLRLDDQVYYAFPTPETLSKLTREQLRESGLSLRKAEYIIDISKLIVAGKLDLDALQEI